MDLRGIRCCDSSQSFSRFSFHSELCFDPEIELSSSQKVLLDQDLLNLILLRVPVRKLICFSSVCKLWHSLITSPRFALICSKGNLPLRASGLFFQINVCKFWVPNFISFVPLDDNLTTSPFRDQPFVNACDPRISRIRIVHSCAGLLLCSSCPYTVLKPKFRYYIYNPTTNHLFTLPENDHCDYYCIFAAVLAFEPSKSSHYRVFLCATPTTPPVKNRVIKQYYIYSSETGTWRTSGQPFFRSTRADITFSNSVYCNGCIHWLSESISLSKTTDIDVGNSIHYFNLDEERSESMPSPPIGLRSRRPATFYMGVSQNHVHVVEVYACDNLLYVYEMESDYKGWFLKYEVDLSPISQVYPQMTINPDQVYILSLVRRENFEEDSFLVLHIPVKPREAVRYNLVDKSFKGIWECSYHKKLTKELRWVRNSRVRWYSFFPPRKFQSFEFVESLVLPHAQNCR